MEPVIESILKLGVAEPEELEASVELASLKAALSARLKTASPADVDYFRQVLNALLALPRHVAPAVRAQLILDIARYFYLVGRSFQAIEPLKRAELLAKDSQQHPLIHSVLNHLGIFYADTGNLAQAIEKYTEALEVAEGMRDLATQAKTWVNLGVALHYSADYENAIACYRRVVDIAQDNPTFKECKLGALSNMALCSLHMEAYTRGLRAARRALAEAGDPQTPAEMLARVLLENNTARLLIQMEELPEAKLHVERAKSYADLCKSPRALLETSITEGLYLVRNGTYDLGLTALNGALEKAQSLRSSMRDVLIALVKAYDFMGQPERALIHLRQLIAHIKETQQGNTLRHVRLQLKSLESDAEEEDDDDDDDPTATLKRQEDVLRGKVAEQELFKARIEVLERLAVTAELRDDATGEHSYRVGKLASLLAAEYGCDEDTVFMLDLAGRLHDVGKIAIPDSILLKQARLNPHEMQIMRTHATVGAEILSKSNIPQMQMAEEIARYHHEWWDGHGYPGECSGKSIPLAARITALADVYDALTHKRPYKEAWPADAAIDEIAALRGRQFDPDLTDLFLDLIARLRREHAELDAFLGAAAQASPFLQARTKIKLALDRNLNEGSYNNRFDLQR